MRLDKLIYQEKWAFMFNIEAILLVNIIFLQACSLGYINKKGKVLFEKEKVITFGLRIMKTNIISFFRIACSEVFEGI